ncbi:hypothetical protein GCM10011575_07520 [Microlunatus endophyticus]|uniref:Uncharacterized protein n=1 Tax=Microlunatus endophyticus TaxID=1716077 RepID=A0A917S1Y1_9ACTN|nr:hypothetical protein [Microlunatus endophyticus]GGL51766.1 hypothetical protein GCM10011575_07520 [Microlunatus endophyticus]
MRTRSAAAAVGAAVALGLVAGGIVLPHYFGPHPPGLTAIGGTPSAQATTSSQGPQQSSAPSASPTPVRTAATTPPPSSSPAPQTGKLGTSLLLRNQDLFQAGFYSSYKRTTGTGEGGSILAGCGGEDESVSVHARTADLIYARWLADGNGHDRGSDLMGYEVIGQSTTSAQATRAADAAVRVLSGCVVEPATHWYYTKPITTTTGSTRLTVFITHDGDGKQSGSIAVFLDRRRFGVLELETYDGTDQQLTKISSTTARRLR